MRSRERDEWIRMHEAAEKRFELERMRWEAERRELLERIQRPERPIPLHPPGAILSEQEIHEPPRDFAEIAHIGQDVSDLPDVGNKETINADIETAQRKQAEEQAEIDKVGTAIGGSE